MTIYPSFRVALADLGQRMKDAPATFQARWQGVNVVNDPSAKTYELMNVVFQVPLGGCEDLSHWQKDISPNLPWADDHFRERVGGEPLNPGEEWKNWPWAANASKFRDRDSKGPEIPDTDWAYLAALIDGDGSIHTGEHPYITIGQVDQEFLRLVQRRFNVGTLHEQSQKKVFLKTEDEVKELKTNCCLIWKISRSDELKWVLSNVLRHIKLKRLKAKKAFDLVPDGDLRNVGNKGREPTFNHNYMQRLWPKYAGMTDGGKITAEIIERDYLSPRRGICWEYGDLDDLVGLLVRDPYTRQAWIPLFFPEDTGWADGGRKPCTLGYQFIRRNGLLHLWYPLRSCDFVRHFRDDCYLAVRLLLWVLNECRKRDRAAWYKVQPGTYSMWMTSLHVFENDRRSL